MAPRKTKSQVSSSQPVPERTQPKRQARKKRRHSDASESVDEFSQQTHANADDKSAKRRRKAREPAVDPLDEADENISVASVRTEHSQPSPQDNLKDDDSEPGHHVHFSSDIDILEPRAAPKMSIKRRNTLSPNGSTDIKRFRTASARKSLPISIADDDTTPVLPLISLRDELDNRKRDLQASPHNPGTAVVKEDDMMVIGSQEEGFESTLHLLQQRFDHQHLVTPRKARHFQADAEALTAMYSSKQWELERGQLQDSILELSQELDRFRTRFHVLQTGLQALDLTEKQDTAETCLQAVREVFDEVRNAFHSVLGDNSDVEMSNAEVLHSLLSSFKDFAAKDEKQSLELEACAGTIQQLLSQVNGLLDRLAASELRWTELEEQNGNLSRGAQDKDMDLMDLEEELANTHQERAQLQIALAERSEQLSAAETHNDELQRSAEKLKQSLRSYHAEEQKLQDIISRQEESHKKAVADMNREREDTVQQMEGLLDDAIAKRQEIEDVANDRVTIIASLEQRVSTLVDQETILKENFKSLDAELQIERESREQAESANDSNVANTRQLEQKIEAMEAELGELQSALTVLRESNDTTQQDLQEAETGLGQSNQRVQHLEAKVQEMGIEANKLRQKMFEVQQRHEAQVAALEKTAAEQKVQFASDFAQEVTRRELAEKTVRSHAAAMAGLQADKNELDEQHKQLVIDHDDHCGQLEADLVQKDSRIFELSNSLRMTEEERRTEAADAAMARRELEASIAALQDTIDDHELRITELRNANEHQHDLHEMEKNGNDAATAQLHDESDMLREQISDLQEQRLELNRRMDDDAALMLATAENKRIEIEALRLALEDKEQKIEVVEQKALEADQRWQDLLEERVAEIEALREQNERKASCIDTLTVHADTLRDDLEKYVDFINNSSIDAREAVNAASTAVYHHTTAVQAESAKMLDRLREGVPSKRVLQHETRKMSQSRKRREHDSGIGLASDEVHQQETA